VKIVLDTNVVLDVLERREPHLGDSYQVLRLAAQGQATALISASSISDIFYIVRKARQSSASATEAVQSLLQLVSVCDTRAADIQLALKLGFADFEDAIVAATAKRERADYIITRNVRDYTTSPVPALTPTEFLADLGQD
jgi:predicted nucleic acid-binding protein